MYNTSNSVKAGFKKIEGGFSKGCNALRINELIEVRDEIMKLLGWSYNKFYYMRRGLFPYREKDAAIIEEFFAKRNINAWTGEILIPQENEKEH